MSKFQKRIDREAGRRAKVEGHVVCIKKKKKAAPHEFKAKLEGHSSLDVVKENAEVTSRGRRRRIKEEEGGRERNFGFLFVELVWSLQLGELKLRL